MLNLKLLISIISCLVITDVSAQTGPILPCVDCEQLNQRVLPASGFWHNPEQQGVTLSIDVQDRQLKGFYNGFDAQGQAIWYSFNGFLKPSSQQQVMWELDTELKQTTSTPNMNITIHIEFNHLSHASLSIDGGNIQNFVPVVFGVESYLEFPKDTTLKVPDLQGHWIFTQRLNPSSQLANGSLISGFQYPFLMNLVEVFSEQNQDGTSSVVFHGNLLVGVPEIGISVDGIGCYTFLDENNQLKGPVCTYSRFIPFSEILTYKLSMAGLGENHLFGQSEDGHVFKAYRYDYCELFDTISLQYACEYGLME